MFDTCTYSVFNYFVQYMYHGKEIQQHIKKRNKRWCFFLLPYNMMQYDSIVNSDLPPQCGDCNIPGVSKKKKYGVENCNIL